MKKILKIKKNSGMTYIELIVVLSIFAVMSAIVLFNYRSFQDRVDIKNLTSDIALQIVQAQKSSLSGMLPPLSQQAQTDATWKPSYGVYFAPPVDDKNFIYFADLNDSSNTPNTQNRTYDPFDVSDPFSCPGSGECMNKITITKGNTISEMRVFYQSDPPNSLGTFLPDLSVTFYRPNSSPVLFSSGIGQLSNVSRIQIKVLSLQGLNTLIKLYPSGRIQL